MKLLVFAHVPPPHHGQSYMVKLMLDGFGGDRSRTNQSSAPAHSEPPIECYHVNAQFSTDMEDVGGFRFGKLWLAIRYCRRALWLRFRHGVKTFYYVPAPAQNTPLFRDWLVLLICRPFFPRLILHWHAVGLGQWNEHRAAPLASWITRKILGNADLSIVLSEFNRKDAERFFPKRIAVVGNGIPDPCPDYETNLQPLQQARRKVRQQALASTNFPATEVKVLFLAHCIREKGLFDALSAVEWANAELKRRQAPLFFTLTVAGEFFRESVRREFEQITSRPEWEGRCRYLGFISQERKQEAFCEADIFCFPTYYRNEGQPVNLIEALAYGLPTVTTRWRAIPELLPDGIQLVDPQHPEQIAPRLLELAQSDEGIQMRGHFLKQFTVEQHLARLSEAILSLERSSQSTARFKIALSILCENPFRKTGLTTLFHEFIRRALQMYPDLTWLVFAGRDQEWQIQDPRVEVCRHFPSNERLTARLFADHFRVPAAARARGADLLITTGFVPLRKLLPTAMQVFSLQHLDRQNRIGPVRRLYRWAVMRFSWSKADLVITNSKFAAHQITTACPGLSAHLVQSYEGLQHEQFHPVAPPDEAAQLFTRFGVQPGYFLWVSNFYPYKQAELLLAGYARLPEALRAAHPLLMVGGSWGNSLRDCKALARQLGIAETVRFLGWIEDGWLAPLYRHARVFCLASREETFGRCVIEAMACGAPCLVNDIPVLREISGSAALLINYRDAEAVKSSLESLATSQKMFNSLREQGLQHARQFTFERLTRERITAIEQMLARLGHKRASEKIFSTTQPSTVE